MRSARQPSADRQRTHLHGMTDSCISHFAVAEPSEQMAHGENSGAVSLIEALAHSVERLERLLDEENAALRAHRLAALEDFNHKKSQALLQWHRTIGTACRPRFDDHGVDLKPGLARLRQKLQDNLALLRTHLNASAAVAAIIARAIEEHESDGTYTPAIRPKEPHI